MVWGGDFAREVSFMGLPGLSLLARTHEFVSRSLVPISILRGTPFISQKLNFQPGVLPVVSSTLHRRFFECKAWYTFCAQAFTFSRSAAFFPMGRITT